MIMNSRFKPWLCTSGNETRAILTAPWYQPERKRILATDGRFMVELPVIAEDGDEEGPLDPAVLKWAITKTRSRKANKSQRTDRICIKVGKVRFLVHRMFGDESEGCSIADFMRESAFLLCDGKYPDCDLIIDPLRTTMKTANEELKVGPTVLSYTCTSATFNAGLITRLAAAMGIGGAKKQPQGLQFFFNGSNPNDVKGVLSPYADPITGLQPFGVLMTMRMD